MAGKTKMVVKEDRIYNVVPYGLVGTVPKGAEVELAKNLPAEEGPRYWLKPFKGMTDKMESWVNGYGVLLEANEVEEVPC